MPDAPEQDLRDERRARARADRTDRLLSAAAGVVAASALAVSLYQTYIMRQQQRMSAWPYVVAFHGATGGYRFSVQNVGTGPALVRSVRVTLDGRPLRRWLDLAPAALGVGAGEVNALFAGDSARAVTTTVARGTVLLPGAPTAMLEVSGRAAPRRVSALMRGGRVRVAVCYCSLYGDCWRAELDRDEPTEVGECPADPGREFRD